MAVPTSRATLISYCKRQLGDGVIALNVSTDQESDAIDNALQYYQDYHYDSIQKTYVSHPVTETNIDDKYITIDDSITGIINIFPVSSSSTTNMFNLRYQIRLNDLFDLMQVSMTHYFLTESQLATIDNVLVGSHPFDFNRHMDRLFIRMDWANDINADEYLIIECYKIIDPDTYTQVYNDRWLKRYATALLKKQWGQNLIKYDGMTLPGGLTYNGSTILDSATAELETLETEMSMAYELPLDFLTG